MVRGWKQSPRFRPTNASSVPRSPEQRKATKKREGAGSQPGARLTRSPNLPVPQRRRGRGPGSASELLGPSEWLGGPDLWRSLDASREKGRCFVFRRRTMGCRAGPWVPGSCLPGPLLPQTPAAVTNDRAAPGDKAGPLEGPGEGIMAGMFALRRWHTPRADGSHPAAQWPPPQRLSGAPSEKPSRADRDRTLCPPT